MCGHEDARGGRPAGALVPGATIVCGIPSKCGVEKDKEESRAEVGVSRVGCSEVGLDWV